MAANNINTLDDLTNLFLANQNQLGPDEQRIFRGILLELGKGENMDLSSLEAMIKGLETLVEKK